MKQKLCVVLSFFSIVGTMAFADENERTDYSSVLKIKVPAGLTNKLETPEKVSTKVSGERLRVKLPFNCQTGSLPGLQVYTEDKDGKPSLVSIVETGYDQVNNATWRYYEMNSGRSVTLSEIGFLVVVNSKQGCKLTFSVGSSLE